MTPEPADWVYDVVLTQRFKESVGAVMWTGAGANRRDEGQGAAFLRACPCQYGPCGWCHLLGRHDRCPLHTYPEGNVSAVAYLRGFAVWPVGRPCRWRCSCGCPPPGGGQLDLLALIGGAR